MAEDRTKPATTNAQQPAQGKVRPEVAAFLDQVKSLGGAVTAGKRGRLIFALDATMSRQPTWDTACTLQGEMFREAASTGGLDIQLVYFRGLGECGASQWVANSEKLAQLMSRIDCRGGHTQIAKVLSHARKENEARKVQALVFVGDAMEEKVDDLCAYREVARLSRGAYCRFSAGAAHELGELLRAVAAYAAGGLKALTSLSARNDRGAQKLLVQLK
jgi:hypothetical protein